MGVHYYVIIPKLKILIWVGRNIHDECLDEDAENMKELFKLWDNYHYEGNVPELNDLKEKNIRNFKVQDLMSVAFYISKIENFLCLENSPETIIKYILAKKIDKNSYVISDSSEKIDKLEKKKYKIIDEEES